MDTQEMFRRIKEHRSFTFEELTDIIHHRALPLRWEWRVTFCVWELAYDHTDSARNVWYRRTDQRYGAVWQITNKLMRDDDDAWEWIQSRFDREIRSACIELSRNGIGKAFSEMHIVIERV